MSSSHFKRLMGGELPPDTLKRQVKRGHSYGKKKSVVTQLLLSHSVVGVGVFSKCIKI